MISFGQMLGCFLIGAVSLFGLGPIFVLTFNRSALYGMWQGFLTALGAAIGDGILFAFALGGFLELLAKIPYALLTFDIVGGIFIIFLGVRLFRSIPANPKANLPLPDRFYSIIVQSLLITLFNPAAIAYFTIAAFKVFPQGVVGLPSLYTAAISVFFGTLVGLMGVAFMAHSLGVRISGTLLSRIGKGSGIIFICFGIYLLYDFYKGLVLFF
jgi:homoserine/homoserine lactone efflux protein